MKRFFLPSMNAARIFHFARLLPIILAPLILSSCVTSRPDLVWTEDGRQFGKASWYDDHGDRTANGEIYNMNAMTAAHPSLALNTVVAVTHRQTGKMVNVRVNDRLPPIHEGRVIDLSKAAFRQLGDLNTGLIDVELRVVKYGNNKYVKTETAAPPGKMYLSNSKSPSRSPVQASNKKTVASRKKTSASKEVTLPVAAAPMLRPE